MRKRESDEKSGVLCGIVQSHLSVWCPICWIYSCWEGLLGVSVAVWAFISLCCTSNSIIFTESPLVCFTLWMCVLVCVNAQGGRQEPPRTKAPLFSEQLASLKRTSLPPLAAPRAPHHSIVQIIQLYTPHTLPSLFSLPEISLFLLCNQSACA